MRQRPFITLGVLAAFVLALGTSFVLAQSTAPAAGPADPGWPRVFTHGDQKVVLYQPQIDAWPEFREVRFRMATAVTPSGAAQPSYGIVQVQATTSVDYGSRTVLVESPQSTVRFPNATADQATQLEAVLRQAVPPKQSLTVSLDRLLACMQPSQVAGGVPVNLAPPKIFYSTQPAILLDFMGSPRVKPIQGTLLMAAVNANWDVFLDEASGDYFLLDSANGNLWLTSPDPLKGPWTMAATLPDSFQSLPATGPWKDVRAALPTPGSTPTATAVKVFTATVPAELIVVKGNPSFEPIEGTKLLAVANTDSALFQHMGDSTWYYLVAGRWFSAPAPEGPWTAATNSLPADFAQIPADDPHAFVLESVPGTQAAADAVLLAAVPRTATVQRDAVSLDVAWSGAPKFAPIPPTALSYGVNTPDLVIQVDSAFYCCHQAVWFTAAAPSGPWSVASSVPAAVYTIPPTSPMYPVTFVRITGSTPDSVTVAYTSGYDGEYVAQTGTVVYGLGSTDDQQTTEDDGDASDEPVDSAYWDTYYHCGPAWYSYGWGCVYGGYAAGCYYRGGAAYGPYCGAARATAYNPVTGAWSSAGYRYSPYGAAAYHAGYNPATDTAAARAAGINPYGTWSRGVVTHGDQWAAGGRETTAAGSAGWVQTSSGAAAAGVKTANNDAWVARGPEGDVYAGSDGNVYKRGEDGSWQQHDGNNWGQAQPAVNAGAAGAQSLDQQASSRQWGNQRASEGYAARSGGGYRGGFRGRR